MDPMKAPPIQAPPAPIRLGCVSYLNTLPLIEGLGKLRDARLTLTAPSRLIDLLLADEVDLALVSLIDHQRSPEPLAALPVGMIGCDGPTMTVRLFSAVPLDGVRTIHADVDSHTSVTLARILASWDGGEVPAVEAFDADAFRAERAAAELEGRPAAWPESLLLIGDKVVADSPPAIRYPHQIDLGEAWRERTGLPFVYAAWMCRAERARDERVAAAAIALDRQRRHNETRLDWIAARHAPVRGWSVDVARSYLRDLLRFEVSPEARQAVDRFFDEAHARGLTPERRPTAWVEPAG
jgi:chorismate dehydratase